MDIIEAINDRHLFRPLLKTPETWASWQVFLKALFALAMTEDELSLYQQCTGRQNPPERPFQEVWAPTGRRSGKSFVAALVAVYLACFRDYKKYLAPGERAMILIIAADRSQAQVIFRYVKGFLAANKMLSRLVESEKAESIDLKNRVTIQISTCSYRSTRGFTLAAVLADEIGFWRSEVDSANPANEVLRALRPGLATIPGSVLVCISSPWARTGPLWQAFNKHFGRDDSDVMVWNAPTTVMNPTISQRVIDRDLSEDAEMARSEWFAEFRSDLESFLSLESIENCIVQNRRELLPTPHNLYKGFCDPSGGRRDFAALGIAHKEKDIVVLDLARAWRAPHDPSEVIKEQAEILKSYRIYQIEGDRYAGNFPASEFAKHGITYTAANKDKSGLYLDFAPLVNAGRCELLDLKMLKNELVSLERRARSAGRDLVDHPPRGHDDLANAVAGVCSVLGTRPMLTSTSMEFLI